MTFGATCRAAECYRAYLAWSRAAGPFWQYVSALPFTVPLERRPRPPALDAGREAVAHNLRPVLDALSDRVLLLADLPLRLGLGLVPALREARYLVVPQVFRWHGERPLLPTADAQAPLLWLAPRLARVYPATARGVAFILDGDRVGNPESVGPRRLDNRYGYPSDVLPPAGALGEWSIREVVFATAANRLRDDVGDYAARLESAGVPVTRLWLPDRMSAGAPA